MSDRVFADSSRDNIRQRAASVRQEFARGWTVLFGCFVGVACGVSSLYFYTLGVFLKPIALEYGWSRTVVSAGTLVSVLTLAAVTPWIGRAADRIGVRWLVLPSMLGLSAGFWSLSYLGDSTGAYLVMTALVSAVAAGTTPVLFTRVVNQWFDRSRGLALGITLAGTGITGAIAPGLLGGYVAVNGWRGGYCVLAIAVLVAALPVGIFLRDPPLSLRNAGSVLAGFEGHAGMTLGQAIRRPLFWLLAVIFFSAALGVGAVIVHLVPMLTDAGLSGAAAGRLAGLIGLAVIAGRLVTGALLDRISAPRVGVVLFAVAACGCVLLAATGARLALYASLAVGFAMGAEVDLVGYLVARYFGMRAYGVIYGCQYTAFLVGTALGPLLVAVVFDVMGTYVPALYGCAAALTMAGLLATRLPRPPAAPIREHGAVLFAGTSQTSQ